MSHVIPPTDPARLVTKTAMAALSEAAKQEPPLKPSQSVVRSHHGKGVVGGRREGGSGKKGGLRDLPSHPTQRSTVPSTT